MLGTIRPLVIFAALILPLSGVHLTAAAQNVAGSPAANASRPPESRAKKKRKKRGWKTETSLSAEIRHDRNPFLLSSGQKAALRDYSQGDVSGRFENMPSTFDFIIAPAFTVESSGPAGGGRKMTVKFKAGYDAYLENTERSYFSVGGSLAHETSKDGRVKVAFDYKPGYFSKNYLTGAVDGNGDGDIDLPDERRYSPAEYDAWDLSANYRHRISNGRRTDTFFWGGAGYGKRTYNAIFRTRDRTTPHADAGLLFKNKKWSFNLFARLLAVDSPRGLELLLLDETVFGIDLNGDGDGGSDLFAATVQLVDRTHTQQRYGFKWETSSFELKYERRFRHFSSHEIFDVAHNGRNDTRDKVRIARIFGKPSKTHARVGAFFAVQDTDRAGDPGSAGEVTDYLRLGGFFSFVVVF